MSTCSDLDPESIESAKQYYHELLSSLSEHYNSVHRVIYQFLCIVGVLANICVVVVLLRPTMRKNSFNLFLLAIAICDMTLMASYFVYKQVGVCHPWYFSFAWIVYTYSYAVLSVFVHSASLWMTVNMAVLRYLVLRSSASSSRRWPPLNTYKAASISVGAALLIAAIGSAPNMLRYQIEDNGHVPVPTYCRTNPDYASHYRTPNQTIPWYSLVQPPFWNCIWERFSFWTAGVLLKLLPCLLLTVFMTLLVRMLVEARERRNRLQAGKKQPPAGQPIDSTRSPAAGETKGGPKAQAEKTTAMLTIIVAVFLVTELPQGILVVAIGVKPQVRFAMSQLSNMIDLLSLLNSSVNFILYATMSNLFRHEFLQTFGFCCPNRLFGWLAHQVPNGAAAGSSGGAPGGAAAGSPPKGTREPTVTLMTGVNGGGALQGTRTLKQGNGCGGFIGVEIHQNGGTTPSKLAQTGQEISKIARKGINGTTNRAVRPEERKKQSSGRPSRESLSGTIASAAVSLIKRAKDREELDQEEEEEEEEQRRALLSQQQNGTESRAMGMGADAKREREEQWH